MIREYEYTVEVDEETRQVSFAGVTFDEYNIFTVKNVFDYFKIKGDHCTKKGAYKVFSNEFGITTKNLSKVLNAVMYRLWVKPYKELLDKYGEYSPYFKAWKVVPVRNLWKCKQDIDKICKYKEYHMAPFLLNGSWPNLSDLKEFLSKKNWKKICGHSLYRNKCLARVPRALLNFCVSEKIPTALISNHASHLHTLLVSQDKLLGESNVRGEVKFLRREKILSNKKESGKILTLLYDTRQMLERLDLTINYNWSIDKLSERHDWAYLELAKIRGADYQKEFTHKYIGLCSQAAKDLSDEGVTVKFLSSKEALNLEGQSMSHCVGGYGEYCKKGQYLIFSIDITGGSRSTYSIRVDSNSLTPNQHYKFGNKQPETENIRIGKEIKKYLDANWGKYEELVYKWDFKAVPGVIQDARV